MAIKLYYHITTHQYLGSVTGGETWVQGDDDSKELQLYFGTPTDPLNPVSTFVNGLTNVTIFTQSGRVIITRPDAESASLSATQITSGTEGYSRRIQWISLKLKGELR